VKELFESFGISQFKTTPYKPETHRLMELMHKTLRSVLHKLAKEGKDWVSKLPFALFSLRSAPNKDTLQSPFNLYHNCLSLHRLLMWSTFFADRLTATL